jgi:hypothetical protein
MAKNNFTTPPGCIVASLQMKPGNVVSLRYHCGNRSEDYHGAEIKGVSGIHLPGVEMHSKDADLRFVLAPKSVRCRKTAYDSVLRCKVFNERGAELSGAKVTEKDRRRQVLTDPSLYNRFLRWRPESFDKRVQENALRSFIKRNKREIDSAIQRR